MKNLTPHAIIVRTVMNGDQIFQPSGEVARVAASTEVISITHLGTDIIRTVYGEVEGLGVPSDYPEGVLVSGLVLGQLGPEWSCIAFGPATGPRDGAIRDEKGHIVAVTKLVTV